jgi:hypothetical protein
MVTIKWDTRDFTRALQDYAATVTKSGDEIVNNAAVHLCLKAAELTHKADPVKISAELRSVASVRTHALRSGKLLKRARITYAATPAAFLIYLKREWKAGRNPRADGGSRAALEAKALKMAARRVASVKYLASGWVSAANAFRGIARGSGGANARRAKPGPGGAAPSAGKRSLARIWNASVTQNKQFSQALFDYGDAGLRAAFAFSQAKLIEITRDRLRRAAEKWKRRSR